MKKIEQLELSISEVLGNLIVTSDVNLDELTITVEDNNILQIMQILNTHEKVSFEQCMDLCGVDYLEYQNNYVGPRFAVVYHLLSVKYNWRLRVKAFLKDDDFPVISSILPIYSSVDWYEREAFDLFGIVFENHPDLRRILTDYGFIGYPFRKDFPISGYMEMKYDEEQKRVIYQPVTIEPREILPRVIRKDNYRGRN